MMKKILLLLLLFLPLRAAYAQHWQLRVGGGVASHYDTARPVGAFKFGVGYEVEFDQHWAFAPALLFYGKGWRIPDEPVTIKDDDGNPRFDEDGRPLTGLKSTSTTAHYLEVPLTFNYYLRTAEKRYVVFTAGPYFAVGLTGKMKTRGDADRFGGERLYYDCQTFKDYGAHRFDCGLTAGLAYQFASGITAGVETDLGVAKFNTAGDRNVSVIVALTYTFK